MKKNMHVLGKASSFDKLHAAIQEKSAYEKGEVQLHAFYISVPKVDVKQLRNSIGMTQKQFSERFGFSQGTLRNWEQGAREPEGPARTLLALIQSNPGLIENELSKIKQSVNQSVPA